MAFPLGRGFERSDWVRSVTAVRKKPFLSLEMRASEDRREKR